MATPLKTLIGKLNQTCRQAAERAASLCMAQGHYEVDLEHLFLALLEKPASDFSIVARRSGIEVSVLEADLNAEIRGFKNGNTRTPVFSPHLPRLFEHAWLIASLDTQTTRIRSGHLLLALLTEPDLAQLARRGSRLFESFRLDELKHDFAALTAGSEEAGQSVALGDSPAADAAQDGAAPAAGLSKTPALDQYTANLTERAREGKIDPVIGRDAEIRQMIDILTRRRQNNPILTGEAGVGKTAVVEGLARGELRTIAATTWSEYKKYFEKDAALARRFQVVKVEEPSEELAASMLRGMAPLMEQHFGVRVLDEAIVAAARLSHRYISGRQLPDKAVSVLDTACARVALGRSATPALIDDARHRLARLETERAALRREAAAGAAQSARLRELDQEMDATRAALTDAEARLEQESELVRQIHALREELEAAGTDVTPEPAGKRRSGKAAEPVATPGQAQLAELQQQLRALQGEAPLVPAFVDAQVIAEIVSAWTGIPLGRMVNDEIRTVLELQPLLAERVIGQDHALHAIAQRVRTARAGLEDPNKPKGVFLFIGPSGVGKTETALAVADVLYGGERKLVTINMSEYQEAHSVSGLKGSPPGYVGYGEGGVLTEAVRRQPYSVVLLDELEKAHPDVLELFFQVFDKGVMDDAEGREIDFRNTLIILTSNVGSSAIMQACLNKSAEERPDPEALQELLAPQLYKAFKPAFLGRMKTIAYYPVDDDALARIIGLKLGRIAQRVQANHRAVFEWDEALVEAVLARCTEVDTGARNVDHILNGTLLPQIAEQVLGRMAQGEAIARIRVTAGKNGDFRYRLA
jgi:type VI secretion system protein VasG